MSHVATARRIVETILENLKARSGVGDELESIDDETMNDLEEELVDEAVAILENSK
jgi:hypothetical protein